MTETERKLIEKAKEGDLSSLEKLLKKYSPYIKRIAMSVCSSYPSLADDVHSETMISIFKNLGRFKNESRFSTWFYKIASNHCYMKYRQIQKEMKILLEDPSVIVERFENDKKNSSYEDFYRALSTIPLIYRNPIILVDIENMSLKEASKILAISVGALKSRLFRGRRMFKENLLRIISKDDLSNSI